MLNLSQNRLGSILALENLPALVALNLGECVCHAVSYVMSSPHQGEVGKTPRLTLNVLIEGARDQAGGAFWYSLVYASRLEAGIAHRLIRDHR